MPTRPRDLATPLRMGILIHSEVSISLALLLWDIFQAANRALGEERYKVDLVSATGARTLSKGAITLRLKAPRTRYDYFLVPPFSQFNGHLAPWTAEVAMLRKQRKNGSVLVSACMGAMILAASGELDFREGTTHWLWSDFAKAQFPKVRWRADLMICDQGEVITSGGFLSVVDLCLYLIAKTTSQKVAHDLGRRLLADSIRQKQSVYAQNLVPRPVGHAVFEEMAGWVEQHLDHPFTLEEMAHHCKMSLRTFQRLFSQSYGTSPKKFLQLKRIEKAKLLLQTSTLSTQGVLEAIGLSDIAAFRKLFQRELGMSLAAFRKRMVGPIVQDSSGNFPGGPAPSDEPYFSEGASAAERVRPVVKLQV